VNCCHSIGLVDNVDRSAQWELKQPDCHVAQGIQGQEGPALRGLAQARPACLAELRGPPSTFPIFAGENGRRRPGRCCISVDWTNGKMDMPVSAAT